MDLVKEIRGALDLAATYFNENPAVGWTEWIANHEAIHADFLKLAIAKADTKLLVAQGVSTEFARQVIVECERGIKNFCRSIEGTETYIVSLFYDRKFHHFMRTASDFQLT